jgi:hypothetical protein
MHRDNYDKKQTRPLMNFYKEMFQENQKASPQFISPGQEQPIDKTGNRQQDEKGK